MSKRIYLSSPHIGSAEKGYVEDAFRTNWVAPLGPNVDAFEEQIKQYCEVKNVVALNSGTAAIHLALILLGVSRGDEVIASSFTFSASINPIFYQGATPIFIDSEPQTWNMCPNILEDAIKDRISRGKRPKAIILVHLYGMPAKVDKILSLGREYDIPIIEDAAEALGSFFNNKPVGSFGFMGVLSFNGNKIITTSGGGALVSNSSEVIEKARFLATQARDDAPHYEHSHIGYNYRLSNILAGIGRGQFEVIDQRVSERRRNHFFYSNNLKRFDGISFLKEPNEKYFSNHWLTAILIDQKVLKKSNMELYYALGKEDIEARPLWKPMHLQPIFKEYPSYINGTSERLFRSGLCLPSGSNMTDDDRQRVVQALSNEISNR